MVKIIYLSFNINLKWYNLFFCRYYQNFCQYRSPCIYISLSFSLVAKSCLTLVTSWIVAFQAPLSMGFSGKEYWSGLPFPFPIYTYSKYMGFPGSSDGKKRLQCRRSKLNHCVTKIPWRKPWQPTPVFLPGEFHGQRTLAGYNMWGHKESDMTD